MKQALPNVQNIRFWLLVALVFFMPLSLQPSFGLPILNFPSFRVGLYQVLALFFVIICLGLVRKSWKTLFKKHIWLPAGLLVVVLAVGFFYSFLPTRTLLYSASLVSLLILGLTAYLFVPQLTAVQRKILLETVLWSGIIFGVLATIQLIVASFDRTALGTLCAGCSDAVFGFPRVNLFSAEPQFLANSLLPAFFASLFFRSSRNLANWSLALTSLAISLTFSRGAFLAICLTLAIYLVTLLVQKNLQQAFRLMKLSLLAGLFGLLGSGLLVASATFRYRDSPYIAYNTTASMLEHISLGQLHIPQKALPANRDEVAVPETTNSDFQPEGYVEASSNDRLEASKIAIQSWKSSPKTVLFGVGLGNLGAFVNQYQIASVSPDFTVYIFYILLLSNVGLIGSAVILLPLCLVVVRSFRKVTQLIGGFTFCLTIAFTIHLAFFGSFINVMYIWLIVGGFLAVKSSTSLSEVKSTPALLE